MKNTFRWSLCLSALIALVAIAWTFTPTGTTTSKQKESSTSTQSGPAPAYHSPGDRHKVSVSDEKVSQDLEKQGGRLIADYGSYKIFDVSSSLAATVSGNANVQSADENNLLLLNSGSIDTSTDAAQKLRVTKGGGGEGKQMHLIQFAGPIRGEWYQALANTGAEIVTYIPNNAYLIYGDAKSISAARTMATRSYVQWDNSYTSFHRLSPKISVPENLKGAAPVGEKESQKGPVANSAVKGSRLYAIQLVHDATENAITLSLIDRLKAAPIIRQARVLNYLNIVVALESPDLAQQLSNRADVVWIAPWVMPHKMDERQDMIIAGNLTGGNAPTPGDYLAYLAAHGFTNTTTTFGVNISDSGVDNATTTPNHFGLYRLGDASVPANSRIVYNRLVGTPNSGSTLQGCDGHGNLNTHIICGYVPTGTVGGVNFGVAPHADAAGFRYGLGVMPFTKVGSSVIFDPGSFTNPNFTTLESTAYNDGMRISSNSWGASDNSYSVDSQEYDSLVRDAQPASAPFPAAGNQEYVIVFAAGNDGSGSNTVGLPGTAKNVITVGASENVQAFGGADGCGTGDTGADSANDIIGFSSRGPTADGRKKPDIVAPGTHVSGGVAQASLVLPSGSGTGAQLACFDGTGVCGGTGGSNFFPAGQQYYTGSSGTSHSTPAMSGYAALMRQFFINNALTPPTPAMTKALMLNSARYLNGSGANDNLFSNNQGMGEANFNFFFDEFVTGSIRRDQIAADKFTASGQQRTFTGTVNDNTKPLRVTLAWTEPPGPTSGNAFVNNLDLEVTVGGNTYKGNVFTGANSVTGGAADTRNNVESVFLPAGVSGSIVVKVKATNIAGNGVPNDADPLDQDFALVVYNATTAAVPVIEGGTAAITAESCAPADNALSPGETVTVNFPLSNVGTANTTNLVATLQATGGVTTPSGPQTYGTLVAGGPAVTKSFTFTVDPSLICGGNVVATFNLQDGATNLGTVTFTFRVGTLGAPSSALYSTGNIAVPIPDVSSVEIPIVVNAGGAVADVNVRVRLNHTFDEDLVIELIAPDGSTVVLSQNRDNALGGGDNYGTGANDCSGTPTIFDDAAATPISGGVPPFAGTFRPETPLSDLNGKGVNGTWKLRVTDTAALDTGTVGCVTLEITRQPFVCCGVAGTPIIGSGGNATITAESITPANNAPDPGETVTATFPVINTGDGSTTNLVGTLQTSGGVTPVTTSRTYGVVVAGGPAVSQPFTFVANGTCGNNITASIHFQDGPTDLGTLTYTFRLGTVTSGTSTFSNNTGIVIPASGTGATTGAPSNPFPSNITVAGLVNPVTNVSVRLKNISHTFPDDVDVLLVGPTGRKFIVISDAGDTNDWVGATLTLDDNATNPLNDTAANGTGTFRPGNFGTVQDPFPAPAPASPYLSPAPGGTDTFASAFNGVDPNGIWSLYVVDDAATDTGQFAGGWDLIITTSQNVCNSQTCSLVCPANITVPADMSGTGAVVNYPAASPTGACGVLNYSIASGSIFPVGTTTVTVTGANAATCTFTVTVTGASSGQLLISEFRERGSGGVNDEYVELYNPGNSPLTVAVTDASTGWALVGSDNVTRFVIPTGTIIPAHGHYLGVNSNGYSLANYGGTGAAAGDITFTTDIPDNTGLALFNSSIPSNFTAANKIDAVGFASTANALFKEGTGITDLSPAQSIEYAFVRDSCGKSGSIPAMGPCPSGGNPVDTNNNASDFYFVDTAGTGAGQRLGAPGPENLGSPIVNAGFAATLVFPCVGASAPPNRVRDFTSDPPNNSTLGTLEIRRKITNNTGGTVTRLRFRVIDISSTLAPPGTADVRVRTSSLLSGVSNPCGPLVDIEGTTLETPPAQASGGGFNSSLGVTSVTPTVVGKSVGKNKRRLITDLKPDGTIQLDAPLANGDSINVRFLLGVQQGGRFKFFINVEALP
ncbi:MAG TPA: S8 family serine peptidase [Pyrinomonadaceae bacterium]|nr:S8 family serine peptidase [Pyrinomonadaceae bacterium]